MEVNDLHVGRKLFVSSGRIGVGAPTAPSDPPTTLTSHPGVIWAENALLVGSPRTYPSPGLEAQLMVGRCPAENIDQTAISIFKVSSRASAAPTGTPVDIMLGDVTGPCGIQMYAGALHPVVIQAKDILFTALTTKNDVAPKKNGVSASKTDANAVKSNTGTKTQTGAQTSTGVNSDNGLKANNAATVAAGSPVTGASDVTAAGGTLNTTTVIAKAAKSLAGKGFDIPHPTKKEHRLRYICLEGPEVGAYFRGTLKDNDTIELPDYWRELVYPETITVNLTPVGSYQELFVDKIEWGTKIKIKNNSATSIHCHYTVFGERKTQDKLQVEYKGLTPDDYPGDNTEYALGGWDYARNKGEPKSPNL